MLLHTVQASEPLCGSAKVIFPAHAVSANYSVFVMSQLRLCCPSLVNLAQEAAVELHLLNITCLCCPASSVQCVAVNAEVVPTPARVQCVSDTTGTVDVTFLVRALDANNNALKLPNLGSDLTATVTMAGGTAEPDTVSCEHQQDGNLAACWG
jgi:hypothetical protein